MKKGDFIRIDYLGRVKDTGEIFDLTMEETAKKENVYSPGIKYGPVPVIVGEGFVLSGLDDEIAKMHEGEKKTVQLEPEKAFGQRKAEMVKVMPLSAFRKQKIDPVPGLVVDMSGLKGRIQSVSSGRVRVDFNNPLAGKTIEYEVEIKEVITKPEEKIKAVFEYMGIENVNVLIDGNTVEVETGSMHPNAKQRIFDIITKNVSLEGNKIEKLKFSEVFEAKKPEPEKK